MEKMIAFASATATSLNQLPISIPRITAMSSSFPVYGCSFSFRKLISFSQSKTCFNPSKIENPPKLWRSFGERVSGLTSNQAFWEDPDNGSGTEYDEDEDGGEEKVENEFYFNNDWEEEEKRVFSASAIEEDELLKEVEQLLEPEERAILRQNAASNLAKISTVKWSALHSLALAGQIRHMDMLLGGGLNIDFVDKDGLTALHTAVLGKKEAVVSHLLRKGASPHVRDSVRHYGMVLPLFTMQFKLELCKL